MLDAETKSRIDSARDILVGKVPDPKSQVEQITIALIYKFMDDMDRQSEELGGKATFFTGDFKKYHWANLLDKRLGGHERLLLYAEGIEKMNENKNIPQLFRDIFKGVFLPYRDPETLNLFLKEINGFSYDHSERLGDAFEYLLSVLGTQGDAGQFRTPRHIIDFIVAVVDPKKHETVLDPACGTAGFLVSAFKHILRSHSSRPSPQPSPSGRGSSSYRGGFDFSGLKKRARKLRQAQTEAESFLWELLRDRQLGGAKFRRQHQFGDYVCDFYCDEAKLVLECDGAVHESPDRQIPDHKRDAYLKSQGLTVLRFKNEHVLNNTEAVLTEIASCLPSTSGRGVGDEGIASGDLTPDERARLMTNFRGYDIAPDMVRLSRANLYLHGFPNPVIHEYDTLTSEERWDERCDVILANPPFMSPKGGIRPHNRFSIKAKRSEVLFVDYMAEHLNSGGRAGIIVPEGIIFQSQNAYKSLRKMLVENYLWAVVSLPAGVFNPYAGVKTSILFLDRNLARRTDKLLFVKVGSDGFDLGAQRRPNGKNDLPEAFEILAGHKKAQKTQESKLALTVSRKRLLESGDINLSGDRYRETAAVQRKWPMVKLGDVCELYQPKTITFSEIKESGPHKVFGANGVIGYFNEYNHEDAEIAVTCRGATCGTVNMTEPRSWITGNAMVVKPRDATINKQYMYYLLQSNDLSSVISGTAQPQITRQSLAPYEVPLPPLDIQRQIVAELDGHRKVIEGARQVLANYKPTIKIDPKWPIMPLGEVAEIDGNLVDPKLPEYAALPHVSAENMESGNGQLLEIRTAAEDKMTSGKYLFDSGCVLYSKLRPYLRKAAIASFYGLCSADMYPIRTKPARLVPEFLLWILLSAEFTAYADGLSHRARMPKLNRDQLMSYDIPLPPLAIQRKIVAGIESERALVEANRKLVEIFEKKIQAKLTEIWGEE